ncbi:putative SGNH hydrolase-type esterase domain-containing protein [Seiridium unicorne]|uniref:SGNH hydrolase-type esterase domain-containing protein n=1 Tax=Seiridium unicorne TaxID=138068 RepID=A0ABR2UQN0_9PEZI
MPPVGRAEQPASFPFQGSSMFKDATLRQTLHLSIDVERVRFQISNIFGGSDLLSQQLQLHFRLVAYTDPVNFKAVAQSMIAINLYFQADQSGGSITGHPNSRTTSWMQQGNHLNASNVTGTSTAHWYFVSAVEAWTPASTSALVILGDSVTDGRGSTDNENNRWPDFVLANLRKSGVTNIAVNNQAADEDTVLTGGLCLPLVQRYQRDLLQTAGAKYAIIFESVNDIGGGSTDSGTQTRIRRPTHIEIQTDCDRRT